MPLPSRRVTSASFPLLAALISASSSGCLCACVCMTMLGAFLWWSGGVQGWERKESHRAGGSKRNHKRVQQALGRLKGLNQRAVTKGRRRGGSNGISILPFGAWSRACDRGWQALSVQKGRTFWLVIYKKKNEKKNQMGESQDDGVRRL